MEIFSRLSTIDPDDPSTWERAFITLDMDWAADDVIGHTIDLIERADVSATWFVTHATDTLARLRENPKFELGIHPNFNFLLAGDLRLGGNMREIVSRLLEIVPEAKSLRSHSLAGSTQLLQSMPALGLTHESNLFVPFDAELDVKPFRLWNGVIRTPHFFEDDLFLLGEGDFASLGNGLPASLHPRTRGSARIYDFHPIHLFLNTDRIERYETSRPHHRDMLKLQQHRNFGIGTRTAFEKLLECR